MVKIFYKGSGFTLFKDIECLPPTSENQARIWQAQEWMQLVQAYGVRAWAVGLQADNGQLLGFALLQDISVETMNIYWQGKKTLRTRLGDWAFRSLRVLNGPVVVQPEAATVVHEAFCRYLAQLDRRQAYFEMTIRPPFYAEAERLSFEQLANIYTHYGFVEERGFTFVVPSAQPLDVLRKRMDRKKRTKINRAKREGIEIDEVMDHAGVERYWKVRCENWRRNGQPIVPRHHFIDTWDALWPTKAIRIFISRYQDHDLAAQTLFLSKTDVELVGVAVSDYNREHSLPGNDYLQWHIIEWAHKQGYLNLDYIGASPNTTDPKEKGIHRFKKSWGGDLVEYQQFIRRDQNWRTWLYNMARNIKGFIDRKAF